MAKKTQDSPEPAAEEVPVSGKGHATPTRKEREEANKRPLVPADRKVASKQEKARIAEERNKARLGMARGDERYLTARDRGPQRKYARDYIDARYSLGEFMIPIMLLVVIMSFYPNDYVQYSSTIVLWIFVMLVVIDTSIAGFLLRKRVIAKFGSIDKGVRWYAAMRSLQMRVLRLPKPQVRRRQYPQ